MRFDCKGQTLIEFAFVVPLILALVFAVVDVAWIFYVNLTMQHALREGTRYAVTGRTDGGNDRRKSLIARIRDNSCGLYDKNLHDPKEPRIGVLSPGQVTFDNFSGTPTTDDPGGRNDIIVVSLTYTCPLLTPVFKPLVESGTYTFTVKSTMTNEPF